MARQTRVRGLFVDMFHQVGYLGHGLPNSQHSASRQRPLTILSRCQPPSTRGNRFLGPEIDQQSSIHAYDVSRFYLNFHFIPQEI